MKLLKRPNYEGSIRKVMSDDKKVCYGLVGTVSDILDEKIFDCCDYPVNLWAFVSRDGSNCNFGMTRDDALSILPKEVTKKGDADNEGY